MPSTEHAAPPLKNAKKGQAESAPKPPRPGSIGYAAMRLGVCRSTIYNLLNRGELKAVKMGRRTIFSDAEIDRLLESLPSWQPRCPQPQDAAS